MLRESVLRFLLEGREDRSAFRLRRIAKGVQRGAALELPTLKINNHPPRC